MMKLICFLTCMNLNFAMAQIPKTLNDLSTHMNKSLPAIYDHATKLLTTSVENNNFFYHFILNANANEFKWALPKVREQVLKTICSKAPEKSILKDFNANIIYRYESAKGLSLGEFMVKPDHCRK